MSGYRIRKFKTPASGGEQKNAGAPEGCRQGTAEVDITVAAPADKPAAEYERVSPEKEASVWLEKEIAASRRTPVTKTITLTPALARVLLDRNAHNRKISETAVAKYARDMSNGAWEFNGEPIIVASDGYLNDGQHRCEAVIASGVSIRAVIVIGTDRTSRFTVDQGRARTAGDFLGMSGHADSLALAAAAGFVWQHAEHGKLSGQQAFRPTKGEILKTVDANPDLAKSLAAIASRGSDLVGGRGMLAFCHFLFSRKAPRADADEFMKSLVSGESLGANDPILYARNRLTAMRGRLRPNEKAELVIRAWNAHRRRERPKTLAILDGALPLVER